MTASDSLSAWMKKNDISMRELAKRSGASATTICRYLAGTQRLHYKTAKMIADATDGCISTERMLKENNRIQTLKIGNLQPELLKKLKHKVK